MLFDPLADLERALRTLGVDGWRLKVSHAEANSIGGTHLEVVVDDPQSDHRHLSEILALLSASGLAPRVRETATAIFERIGRAESKVHGIPFEEVHFHEVGAVDSIVDVCGAAVALDLLGWPRVVSAVPELGQGSIRTSHGVLPVPPPAVLEILRGKAVKLSGPPGEAVTPTGAALLAVLAEVGELPAIEPDRVGYGIGTSRWPDRPNVLRMTLGKEVADTTGREPERDGNRLWVIEANLDDCPGQLVARAIEVALSIGALDAWAAPIIMKKGRPGLLLGALATEDRRQAVVRSFFSETTTLGVRFHPVERVELAREWVTVETAYGTVRVKVAREGDRALGAHPEYSDCLARATEQGVPVKEVMAAALAGFRSR